MKNKKEVNIEGIVLTSEIPESVLSDFKMIAKREQDFLGEKLIDNGYILKCEENKIAITVQRGYKLYSAKLKYSSNSDEWKIEGEPIRWDNVEPLLMS